MASKLRGGVYLVFQKEKDDKKRQKIFSEKKSPSYNNCYVSLNGKRQMLYGLRQFAQKTCCLGSSFVEHL